MGERKHLRKFMDQMRIEQLFSEGKYVVIYLSPHTILPDELTDFMTVVSNFYMSAIGKCRFYY